MMEEETVEEIISVPPTVSEDAPSEPHMGEPASESQPQPVYPDGEPDAAAMESEEPAEAVIEEETMEVETPDGGAMMEDDTMAVETPEGEAVMEEETIVVSPSVADDAPSEPHMGEPASESQPQPVYPDGAP